MRPIRRLVALLLGKAWEDSKIIALLGGTSTSVALQSLTVLHYVGLISTAQLHAFTFVAIRVAFDDVAAPEWLE